MKKILYFIASEKPQGLEFALEDGGKNEIAILLVQNAIYFGNKVSGNLVKQALEKGLSVYALKHDVISRGFQNFIHEKIKQIEYSDVADLAFANDSVANF